MLESKQCDLKNTSSKRIKTNVTSTHTLQNKQVPSTDILPSTSHGSITTSYNMYECNNTNITMTKDSVFNNGQVKNEQLVGIADNDLRNEDYVVKYEEIYIKKEEDIDMDNNEFEEDISLLPIATQDVLNVYEFNETENDTSMFNCNETNDKLHEIEHGIDLFQNAKTNEYETVWVKTENIDIKEEDVENIQTNNLTSSDVSNTVDKKKDKEKRKSFYECPDCNYKAINKYYLNSHINRMHNNGSITHFCDYCNYSSISKDKVTSHINNKHRPKKCKQCPYTAPNMTLLIDHMRSQHQGLIFICNKCDYKTDVKGSLTEHMERKHNDGTVSYFCDRCGYKSHSKYNLKTHVRTKHQGFIHVCNKDKCDYKTETKRSLNEHMDRKHNDGSVTYVCSKCEHVDHSKYNFKEHMRKKHK